MVKFESNTMVKVTKRHLHPRNNWGKSGKEDISNGDFEIRNNNRNQIKSLRSK